VATIQVTIPSVPDRPGETLTARLKVQSNGNQRFVVPVTLQVASNAFDFGGLGDAPPRAAAAPPPPPPAKAAAVTLQAVDLGIQEDLAPPPPPPISRRAKRGKPAWVHLVPALLLALGLGGVLALDISSPVQESEGGSAKGEVGLSYGELTDPDPRLAFLPNPAGNYRFGLLLLKETDPENPDRHKRLTYQEPGTTNNTCVKIEGRENLYGQKPGKWANQPVDNQARHYWRTNWIYPENILVTQEVQIVPGAQSGLLDTCLVHYTVKNQGHVPRKVGLRVMFDTYIGANDGVPFVVPGRDGLVTTPTTFTGTEVPDYIQALEKPDLKEPGTIAHMGLKGIQVKNSKSEIISPEPIERVVIRPFDQSEARWEPELDPKAAKATIKDSCILLYWEYREMPAQEERHMAFSYGLNAISAPEGSGNLALTVGGSFVVGNDFTVTAYVKDPKAGQKVKLLDLPAGLELLAGEKAEKEVAAKGDMSQVSWGIRSKKTGVYSLTATSTGARAAYKVKITDVSLFR
jgi:hypothetical protein